MKKRILGIAGAALLAAACDVDRPTGITQPSLRSASALVSDASELCAHCVLGPRVFVRRTGAPVTETIRFAAAPAAFVVDIDNMGTQGASADVSLNGVALVADGLPAHCNKLVTLKAENTLIVRLTGKPGSQLRVAVWLFKPATLDAMTLTPSSVRLDGSVVAFNSTITNHTSAPVSDVSLDLWVLQRAARKSWGRNRVRCGSSDGVLPLTPCITESSFHESISEVGDGVLVPGDALAVVRLIRGASEVLDSLVVPIVLPTPAPAVLRVSVDPRRIMLLPNTAAQVTANVQVVGGASKTVTWSVIGAQAVTVSPTGLVTAVGMGYSSSETWIKATSTADPTKSNEIPVAVYDWRLSTPNAAVQIATGPSASHPTSVDLRAGVCGDIGMIPENPFTRVEFTAMSNGIPVTIGAGAVSHSEWIGPGGMHWTCWYWDLTWTPGTSFGLGQQTLYATAFGFPGATLATLANMNVTTVAP